MGISGREDIWTELVQAEKIEYYDEVLGMCRKFKKKRKKARNSNDVEVYIVEDEFELTL